MKALTVSATDRFGGAGIAAYRTHQALQSAGVDSEMLVWRKLTSDPAAHRLTPRLGRGGRFRRRLSDARHQRALRTNPRIGDSAYWSLNTADYPLARIINSFDADIVHLHWIGDNFLPIAQLQRIDAPIVWTLHDMWAFSGGCHYAGDCVRYEAACGACPQLAVPSPGDVSAKTLQAKRDAWTSLPLTIVCPSHWLADCARRSSLFRQKRVEVIGNPIGISRFKPLEKQMARSAFNLPADKQLILFGAVGGATDRRKGFRFLREALLEMQNETDIELVVFGAEKAEALDLPLPSHQIGALHDEVSLCLLYNACDVFVLPSLQDNLPNTVLEALACGLPCIAFDVGGIADLVRHERNGYLAKAQDAADLRRGIHWTLAQAWSPARIRQDIAERFAAERIAERYRQLYLSVLGDAS